MNHETARAVPRLDADQRVTSIPFSELPHQSRLFLDYLNGSPSLRRFYPNAVPTPLEAGSFASTVLDNYSTDRGKLSDALAGLNTDLGAGDRTLENITRLRQRDCVAVVTGQQAGLFTGPLYTIYKALSAIRLADHLTVNGVNAVPVFWVASEDHDFDEVSQTALLSDRGVVSVSYPSTSVIGGPVGSVIVDESMRSVLDASAAVLSPEILSDLRSAYAPNTGFATAFAKTLIKVLGRFGLVVLDPMDSAIKGLSGSLYAEAIAAAPRIVEDIRARTDELENAGYHAQVLVEDNYFPFFWHDDGGRRVPLRRLDNGRYRVKDSELEFDLEELLRIAVSNSERFSPGVMLRPVVQDSLLPTLCYFGGAAEIAYFAQNGAAYERLGRPVTPVFHRQSFTIIEPRQRRILNKLGLQLPDLFKGGEELRHEAALTEFWSDTGRLFADAEEKINGELNRLDQRLNEIDITLAYNLAKRRRKMLYHIAALKKKTLLAQARKHEVLGSQIDELVDRLIPNGQLQERSINVFSFIEKYGHRFVDRLYAAVDLGDKAHRVIEIK